MEEHYDLIGKSINRVDAVAKVTGKAKYCSDYFESELLVGMVLRSPYAHAKIKNIDTKEAENLEGVEAVLTYKNVPNIKFPTAGHPYSLDPSHRDIEDCLLLTDKARFVGDSIAAVVATDELIAKKALKLIKVEYEVLPFVIDQEEAIKEGAPAIHEERPNNIISDFGITVGNPDEVFKNADKIYKGQYETQIVQHCQMETHNTIAKVDERGRMLIISSTQIPHIVRRIVSKACNLPIGKIRVIKPYIGGGFGGKQDVIIEPLTAAMSLAVNGRPVRLQLSREEAIVATRTRHSMRIKIKMALANNNKIEGYDIENFVNNGAYASHGHSIAMSAGSKIRPLYDIRAEKYRPKTIYTNLPVAGAMRAYGVPQICFAIESMIDDICKDLNVDPVDFRINSFIKKGHIDPDSGLVVRTFGLPECLKKGRELIEWDKKRKLYKNQIGDIRRGVGMACFSYFSGTWPVSLEAAGTRIVMNQDGSVQVQVGATEIGQGSDTVFTQMAAETIGIPFGTVTVISQQDTDVTPFDTGSYASRQSFIAGQAIKKAATEVKRKVLKIASDKCGLDEEFLDIVDAKIIEKGIKRELYTLEEIALEAYYNKEKYAPITSDLTVKVKNNAIVYGATFVEVEVDIRTGKIKILDIYNIHDSGKILNRKLAEGQVHGGVSMALGFALSEKFIIHEKTGAIINNNLLHYKLPTIMDTPKINCEFVNTYDPTSSYGQKSLGESTTISPAPAIRNAVLNATGVAFNKLPMDSQTVFEKFKEVGLI
ncbi:xanthine dehydrogenase molybdenum-binding subunit XdhA [Clostridium sporogenes]|uniref:xanthine dehydrogenase molybdenum-binding subunit XdhA n=1 Tax=unclassified Clostridium TaxID=2614128 RepID=UPI0013D2BC7C|nr:xanthine dehydrogenase molybdenum-binding subunit XdhA [Clostridium sporogenes]NFS26755.1 xanthine dehydrogenase molybdenum-binding subunit XdhA [Clostridium sporogenes]